MLFVINKEKKKAAFVAILEKYTISSVVKILRLLWYIDLKHTNQEDILSCELLQTNKIKHHINVSVPFYSSGCRSCAPSGATRGRCSATQTPAWLLAHSGI